MRKFSILLLVACFLTATSSYAQKVKPVTKVNETKISVNTKTKTSTEPIIQTTIGVTAPDAVIGGTIKSTEVKKVVTTTNTTKVTGTKKVVNNQTNNKETAKPKEETIPVLMTADPVK